MEIHFEDATNTGEEFRARTRLGISRHMTTTPRQRAEWLLETHRGACFVIAGNELQDPFRAMEKEGLVTVREMSVPTPGIDVRKKRFSPMRFRALEPEPLAH